MFRRGFKAPKVSTFLQHKSSGDKKTLDPSEMVRVKGNLKYLLIHYYFD